MNIHDYLNRKVTIEDDLCFVLMPFAADLTEVFFNGIKPIVESLGYRCQRADEHFGSSPIMFEIFDDILRSGCIIADLTGSNPNVFYELGIAHALKRNVILLKQAGSIVPFDLMGIRHYEYEDSFKGIRGLRNFLTAAITKSGDMSEMELLDKRELAARLKKACRLWSSDHTVIMKYEEFLEIVLGLDLLNPTDTELAFLCHAASYYGKFMKRMSSVAKNSIEAAHVLVIEAATIPMTRVPWRAAAMLENFDREIVEKKIREYAGPVVNPDIFPDTILLKSTISSLEEIIKDQSISANKRDKLIEALRQINAEFRIR
ncbi:MAG: hypothetical protein M0T82_12510 [Desulfobacteraceae bacterium]|nr:hypothetical protein [Desulfobacteraceae bacterium]